MHVVLEGNPVPYTVSRTGATAAALTVLLRVSERKLSEMHLLEADYLGGKFFVASSNKGDKTVTIPSGRSSVTYSVPTAAYTTSDISSLVAVDLRSDSAYTKGAPSWAGVRVANDNKFTGTPTVTVTPGTSPVTEGATATFTVSRTGATTAALTVQLAVSEDETGGRDFVVPGNQGDKMVTVPGGSASATYSVPTVDDKHGRAKRWGDGGTEERLRLQQWQSLLGHGDRQ